jgi:hypothetical protein
MERPRLSVEQQIRAAQARGAFDNLPGAGKPLDLGDADDPDWWIKSLVRREKIDTSLLLHPTIALRREADTFPESLAGLQTENQVRAVLDDFNERVRAEWRRPASGPSLPVVARQVAVEPMLGRWRELRERSAAEAGAADPSPASSTVEATPTPRRRRRWWSFGG